MRGIIKRYRRIKITREIGYNRDLITAHRNADPDAFNDREQLYMRHHELLGELEGLDA